MIPDTTSEASMGELDTAASSAPERKTLSPEKLICACGRWARRGRPTCFFCAPDVSAEQKFRARRNRPALALQVDVTTPEGRQQARQDIAEAALRDEVPPSQAQVALRAIEGARAEAELQRQLAPPPVISYNVVTTPFTKPGSTTNGSDEEPAS